MRGRPKKYSNGFKTFWEWMEVEKELYILDELQTQLQFITESEDV